MQYIYICICAYIHRCVYTHKYVCAHMCTSVQLSSVTQSCPILCDSMNRSTPGARPPCPSPTPRVHSDSCPLSRWCHPVISSCVVPFAPAPNPFQHQSLFQWVNTSHDVDKETEFQLLASFLPKKSQGWSPSEWTGWISLQSKGLSRVFSNTTVQKHHFFSAQLSSQSNSHIHTWPLEKP